MGAQEKIAYCAVSPGILPEDGALERTRVWRIAGAVLGALLLSLGSRYRGPGEILVHSYGSNIAFSFAAYFLVMLSRVRALERIGIAATVVAVGVSLTEIAQKLKYLDGVFDSWDLAANFVGIGLAIVVDSLFAGKRMN
ncbi:MAG: hypothetical protein IPK53_00035 [bacterium]|nr:hypothetical protein [bacterium]